MTFLVCCYFHVLCQAVTIQQVTEASHVNVSVNVEIKIKTTNNNQFIRQCRVYVQNIRELFEEIDNR